MAGNAFDERDRKMKIEISKKKSLIYHLQLMSLLKEDSQKPVKLTIVIWNGKYLKNEAEEKSSLMI